MRLKSVESYATWNERKEEWSFARVSGLRPGGEEGSCLEARPAYVASRAHAVVQMIFFFGVEESSSGALSRWGEKETRGGRVM